MQILNLANRLLSSKDGIKINWFQNWHPELDEALQDLPETQVCPHELYRMLVQNPAPVPKITALITDQGTPVAVIGLRQKGRLSWEPVTQWIIPGTVFPAKPGYIIPALEALGREIWVAWWRMVDPPTPSPSIRYLESTPTYRMSCSEDFEQYWREIGYFKTIRRIRNRCRNFKSEINSTRSAEWTIKNWEARWRKDPSVMDPGLPDRILAAKYLENLGRYYSILLLDGDTPIGGATVTVHNNDLVAGVLYRDPQYHRYGIGDRLIDMSFSLAAEKGFDCFDIGGGHDYKKNWARKEGERWFLNVCPEPLFQVKKVANWVRNLRGRDGADLQQHVG
jgi:hypothetical protein